MGVDNRSDARAVTTVSDSEGNVLSSNYTLRSIARNYVGSYVHRNAHPTEDGASCFQNMYVFFTAPESGDLTPDPGAGRDGEAAPISTTCGWWENESDHFATHGCYGSSVPFTQDFEHVGPGSSLGGCPGDTDRRTHLSEPSMPPTPMVWAGT